MCRPYFLLLFPLTLCSQRDSILRGILELRNDTERVNLLYQNGFGLRNTDPGLSYKFARLCEQNAQKSNSKKHIAKSYNLLGILFYKKGDYKKALDYHHKALKLREETSDKRGVALSHTNLGNVYSELQLFMRAEQSYLGALNAFREIGDKAQTANCLINLGVLAHQAKRFEAAFNNYSLANQIAEEIHNYEVRSICLNNIAEIFYDGGDYTRSISYNQDALKLRDLMENTVEAADSYLNLSLNYIRLAEFEKAKTCVDTAYSISVINEYLEGVRAAQRIYSDYFSAVGDFKSAYNWLQKYQVGTDSIILMQGRANELFDENDHSIISPEKKGIKNLWLIVVVFFLILIVPLCLVRFKR